MLKLGVPIRVLISHMERYEIEGEAYALAIDRHQTMQDIRYCDDPEEAVVLKQELKYINDAITLMRQTLRGVRNL